MVSDVDLFRIHQDALAFMTATVYGIAGEAWNSPSPCDEWTVRDVVNHITAENLWAEPLMDGKTIDQVGDQFDGDVLGDDPLAAWDLAAKGAASAFARTGAAQAVVHVSWGDISGRQYLEQMTTDLIIHGWDVLRGSGQDDEIPEELVATAIEMLRPVVDSGEAATVFKPPVEVGERADTQTKLLAMAGRCR